MMPIRAWLNRKVWRNVTRTVSPQDAEAWLTAAPSKELVDELFGFGGHLLSEVTARTSAIDAKANWVLGWSAAVLASVVVGSPQWISTNNWGVIVLVSLALASALVAAVAASMVLHIRDWSWPSERDWLCHELFGDPVKLRAFHLVSMLETHQSHVAHNNRKGDYLVVAQWGLVLAVVVVGGMAITRVWWLFLAGLV